METRESPPLRRGWTTGACATAAVRAGLCALWGGAQLDEVQITLPKGEALFSPSTRYRDLGLSTRFLPAAGH